MKCALELLVIQKAKQEEIALAKRLREEEQRRKLLERTTVLCEKLANKLEELANCGEELEVSFMLSLRNNVLNKRAVSRYADGCSDYEYDDTIDLNFIAEWFSEYCFTIKKEEVYYYSYGNGYNRGYKISVIPDPKCCV